MSDTMGTFRIDIEIENPARPGVRRVVESALVDTGAELSWIPSEILESLGIERYTVWRFRQANGSVLERWTGAAFVFVAGKRAADDVVFGEPGDLVLLIRVSERVGLSEAEPRQYCRAVSAILHWSAEDSPTPSTHAEHAPLFARGHHAARGSAAHSRASCKARMCGAASRSSTCCRADDRCAKPNTTPTHCGMPQLHTNDSASSHSVVW